MARLNLTGVAGTDTESIFVLSIDNVTIDHSVISRARLYLVGTPIALDSAVYPAAWDFSDPLQLTVRLGRGDLVTGRYRGRLVTHDVDHANGLSWDDDLEITIL
jgi:hypothetical protein